MSRHPPRSTLFHTTLFRSLAEVRRPEALRVSAAEREVVDRLPAEPDFPGGVTAEGRVVGDRKSTRLNSSHEWTSYAVFCLKKKINACSMLHMAQRECQVRL